VFIAARDGVAVRNQDPVLSLVLPVRDAEPFIADALNSLRHNADPGFEFIVVDDGSVDGTSEVIAEHARLLPQLRVIRHDGAVGLADARNVGISAARGRYVTFLDGDDWLAPDYLAQLVKAIDTFACDFVRVDHVQVKGRKRMVFRAPEARRGVVLDPRSGILPAFQSTMVDYPYAWAGIYRRELGPLLRFPVGLHTAEDRPWIWRLHREARSYAVVSLAGVFYRRQVANSLTQTGDVRQLDFLDAFALVLEQVADEPALELKAVRQYLAVLAHHLRSAGRMNPSVTRRMVVRARTMLAEIPADVLTAATPKDSRARVLQHVLRAGVARRRSRAALARVAAG
jgi:glycosyltransferase involved in cell wall biosynthesis